jgi:hypothetical protein
MDGTLAPDSYSAVSLVRKESETSRRAAPVASKRGPRGCVELPVVQILVVVANIQVRPLKTEVEKGSM